MEFSGKTVLVTGGASGIGCAISLAFGRAGGNVILSYVTSEQEAGEVAEAIGAAGGQALFRPADVTDAAEVGDLFEAGREPLRPDRYPRGQCRWAAQAQPLRRHGFGIFGTRRSP